MIRPTRSSLSAPLVYLDPEKLQYCNIIEYFVLFILFLVHFCRVVTWKKNKNNKEKI